MQKSYTRLLELCTYGRMNKANLLRDRTALIVRKVGTILLPNACLDLPPLRSTVRADIMLLPYLYS